MGAKFDMADENGDGYLQLNELPAAFFPETHAGSLELSVKSTMKEKDTDADGKLTPKEFWQGDAGDEISQEDIDDFQKMDTNGDGMFDEEELKAWESGRFHTEEAMRKIL